MRSEVIAKVLPRRPAPALLALERHLHVQRQDGALGVQLDVALVRHLRDQGRHREQVALLLALGRDVLRVLPVVGPWSTAKYFCRNSSAARCSPSNGPQ